VTTSTQDSRLFGHILPLFKAKTGIDVKVVAQGTGQALDTGRCGERRRCVRPRQIGGGEIPGGRLWREALPGDVQRIRPTRGIGNNPTNRDEYVREQLNK
jgi:hypothetical protein